MKNLNSLISRFTNLLDKKNLTKETVASVISKHVKRRVSTEEIFLESDSSVLEVVSKPALKSDIRLKEEAILDELKGAHNIHIKRILYK